MPNSFIIDCDYCKAKVAAIEKVNVVEHQWFNEDMPAPEGLRLYIGQCPQCECLLVGKSDQIYFKDFDADYDLWSDIIRLYPSPPKIFNSTRIPRIVEKSFEEAKKSIHVGAYIAACIMLGRALEALFRDILKIDRINLNDGIKKLKEANIIDQRLLDWGEELRVYRNLSAHADDKFNPSQQDAEDFLEFISVLIHYIYDFTDRYNRFIARKNERSQ